MIRGANRMRMIPLSVPMLYPLTCDKNPTVTMLPCISSLAVALPVGPIGIQERERRKVRKGERRRKKEKGVRRSKKKEIRSDVKFNIKLIGKE